MLGLLDWARQGLALAPQQLLQRQEQMQPLPEPQCTRVAQAQQQMAKSLLVQVLARVKSGSELLHVLLLY